MKRTQEQQYEEAVWVCEECGVWWASQSEVKPTRLMLDLPPALSRQLPWDAYRGWKLREAAVCPECGQAQEAPVYGEVAEVAAESETAELAGVFSG